MEKFTLVVKVDELLLFIILPSCRLNPLVELRSKVDMLVHIDPAGVLRRTLITRIPGICNEKILFIRLWLGTKTGKIVQESKSICQMSNETLSGLEESLQCTRTILYLIFFAVPWKLFSWRQRWETREHLEANWKRQIHSPRIAGCLAECLLFPTATKCPSRRTA